MIDHKPRHSPVNTNILPRNKPRHIRAEVQHHARDIGRDAHPPRGLLGGVGAGVDGVGVVDPAWGDRIDPYLPRKTHRQGVGQRRDPALGGGVALGLGLTHAVAGGGDVHDARALGEVGRKEFGKVEGSGDTHLQGVLEILVAPACDTAHLGGGVVDEKVHPAVVGDDLGGEALQGLLVGKIPHEIVVVQKVNDANGGARRLELLADALADAAGAPRDYGDLICEIKHRIRPPS